LIKFIKFIDLIIIMPGKIYPETIDLKDIKTSKYTITKLARRESEDKRKGKYLYFGFVKTPKMLSERLFYIYANDVNDLKRKVKKEWNIK